MKNRLMIVYHFIMLVKAFTLWCITKGHIRQASEYLIGFMEIKEKEVK